MDPKKLKRISFFSRFLSLRLMKGLSGMHTIFPFYHVVSDRDLAHLRHLYPYRSEWQFEQDLETMLRYFEPVSLDDYLEAPKMGKGKARMVLSFDDGLVECHSYIAPFLRKKGVPAIFFLNNDFIDNRGLFYRYKASILLDHLGEKRVDRCILADYMAIPEDQVRDAVRMITYRQLPLLDALMDQLEMDDVLYMRDHPVYMSSDQVNELIDWGFDIGGHSADHPDFSQMEEKRMEATVSKSMEDLKRRFPIKSALFAFPFSSDGVPEGVIRGILEDRIADVLFGTAGLKDTGMTRLVQRIPMEEAGLPAGRILRAEYLGYLMKVPFGRNHYFQAGR